MEKKNQLKAWLYLSPAIVLLLVFTVWPIINTVRMAFLEGYSVLDVVKAYEKACGKTIPYEIKPRRAGDIATCYSDATKAKNELGWEAQYGIEEMCADSWKWQSMNPNGYRDAED